MNAVIAALDESHTSGSNHTPRWAYYIVTTHHALACGWQRTPRACRDQLAPSWHRALRDQDGRCPLCGELLLFADRAPDSPGQWETWFAAVGKAMTRQAIADDSTGRTKHRLVHAHCARRHPDGGPHGTDQQNADT